jgi:hypothetical protein
MSRKREPYTRQWYKDAINEALIWAPKVYPCVDCHNPVVDGYVCGSCGSSDPCNNNPYYDDDDRNDLTQ